MEKIEKIIFLDIDGVLNHNKWFDWAHQHPEFMKEGGHKNIDPTSVNKIIELCNITDAGIVMSSSWRYWSLGNTIKKLSSIRDLRPILDRLIGITPRTDIRFRGEEIKKFLDCCKNQNFYTETGDQLSDGRFKISENPKYVIFDDDNDMLDEQLDYFIQTDDRIGITDDDVKNAIKILTK